MYRRWYTSERMDYTVDEKELDTSSTNVAESYGVERLLFLRACIL